MTRVEIQKSKSVAGKLAIKLRASASGATLPSPASVDATVVSGAASECADVDWNGPGGATPHCEGDVERLVYR